MTTAATNLDVRLTAPSLDLVVDVNLRSSGDRWIAAADIAGELQIGLAATARQALAASLASLGDRVRTLLLADLSLLKPSLTILEGGRGLKPAG